MTQSYAQWAPYVCAARDVAEKSSSNNVLRDDRDFMVILGWLHYHYVLGNFTVLHWPRGISPGEWVERYDGIGIVPLDNPLADHVAVSQGTHSTIFDVPRLKLLLRSLYIPRVHRTSCYNTSYEHWRTYEARLTRGSLQMPTRTT